MKARRRRTAAPALMLAWLVAFGPLSLTPRAAAQSSGDGGDSSSLETLVAPIALYPDSLVAQILPASTYPVEIVEAARAVANGAKPAPSDLDQWDPSIQALTAVPTVLKMMNDRLSWTTQLGQAVAKDQGTVMAAIQSVRAKAKAAGNLQTNDKQVVLAQGDTIVIQPANPQLIYVPQYDPVAILAPPPPYYAPAPYGLMGFGVGFAAGALTAYACNWGGGYHGGTVVVNNSYNYNKVNTWHTDNYNSWHASTTNVAHIDSANANNFAHTANVDRANGAAQGYHGWGDADAAAHPAADHGDAGDMNADRAASERGGAFAGAGGGGWQAREDSARGAYSMGGGYGGGGYGGARDFSGGRAFGGGRSFGGGGFRR